MVVMVPQFMYLYMHSRLLYGTNTHTLKVSQVFLFSMSKTFPVSNKVTTSCIPYIPYTST